MQSPTSPSSNRSRSSSQTSSTSTSSWNAFAQKPLPRKTYGRRAYTSAHVQGMSDQDLWSRASPVKVLPRFRRTNSALRDSDQDIALSEPNAVPEGQSSPSRQSSTSLLKKKTTAIASDAAAGAKRVMSAASYRKGKEFNNENRMEAGDRVNERKGSLSKIRSVIASGTSPRKPLQIRNSSENVPLAAKAKTDLGDREPIAYVIPETERFDFSDLAQCLDIAVGSEDSKGIDFAELMKRTKKVVRIPSSHDQTNFKEEKSESYASPAKTEIDSSHQFQQILQTSSPVSGLRRSASFTITKGQSTTIAEVASQKDSDSNSPNGSLALETSQPAVSTNQTKLRSPKMSSPLREVTNYWELDGEDKAELESDHLLHYCTISEVLDFSDHLTSVRTEGWKLEKLGEASYSEVFAATHAKEQDTVLKVMPFGQLGLEQASIKEIENELRISKTLMMYRGFVQVVSAHIVKGQYPADLLVLWDQFAKAKGTENDRPDYYGEDQLFCVIMLHNGGIDLEHFELRTWREAATVFWRVTKTLAVAESRVDFEHRDLHWGNIVLHRRKNDVTEMIEKLKLEDTKERLAVNIQVTVIDYTLSRAVCGGEIVNSSMDDPTLYTGRGDYQFDVYRFMRKLFPKLQGSEGEEAQPSSQQQERSKRRRSVKAVVSYDWASYRPQTNTFWLHYLADRLLHHKNLEAPRDPTRTLRSRSGGPSGTHAVATDQSEMSAYRSLDLVYKLIDPRRKRFGAKKGGASDIVTTVDLLRWGIDEGIVYE
ncbi:uncharacterized protein V1516DRAFT_646928 [Lipomyces oligophaga]|uniref:uncharacterized protein n=1 Tax=Lipomyces oligophaga TaxID=45792 RepID=UPI0034CD2D51